MTYRLLPLGLLLCLSSCLVVIADEELEHRKDSAPRTGHVAVDPERLPTLSATDLAPHPGRQRYVCHRAADSIVIDGRVDEASWLAAPETELFVDIQGPALPTPRFATRARMLWDDEYFYVSAVMEEPHLWGTLTERDSIIFYDNDFEVFIDPDGDTFDYYELEVNALGTEWDLLLERPYRDGGPALHEYDTPGLKTAVHLDGTLNDPGDVDAGWSIEIAIPFHALRAIAGRPVPPVDGDVWWVNYSRVQWHLDVVDGVYVKRTGPDGKGLPEDNWVWSQQGVIAMHEPESWGLVMFADEPAGEEREFVGPEDLSQRELLRIVYEAQHRYRKEFGRYADAPELLGLPPGSSAFPLELHTTPSGFEASATWAAAGLASTEDAEPMRLRIDERGHVW